MVFRRCQFQLLSFTTLFTLLESAAMPHFVLGVDCAEPLPTNAAMARGGSSSRVECSGRASVARLSVTRDKYPTRECLIHCWNEICVHEQLI